MKFPLVCLAAHDWKLRRWVDFRKCQTSTATPAEPGGLPCWARTTLLGRRPRSGHTVRANRPSCRARSRVPWIICDTPGGPASLNISRFQPEGIVLFVPICSWRLPDGRRKLAVSREDDSPPKPHSQMAGVFVSAEQGRDPGEALAPPTFCRAATCAARQARPPAVHLTPAGAGPLLARPEERR
jgi:hypothetical protein